MSHELKVAITLMEVNSSNIKAIGHTEEGNILEVEFWGRGGSKEKTKKYRYWPVTATAFQAFKYAESKGIWFAANIRNNEKITCKEC